jgi:EmrB/QacA subfamily drug resistance transporter
MAIFIERPCENVSHSGGRAQPAVAAGTWVLIATVLGSAMPMIDGTAVNVVLPILQRDLHADSATVQWIVEGYSLFLSALILIGGALGDVFGRRRMFVLGTMLFALASIGCAFSTNAVQLIAARCVQGVGAALLVPESLALISAQFEPKERAKAIGTWSAFSAISAAIGPVLGGYIAQHFSWRWVFLINVPISAFIIYLSLRHISESHDETVARSVDVGGAVLASLGLGGIVYALIASQGHEVQVLPVGIGVAALLLLVVFVYYEGRAASPMMPLRFFRSPIFAGANVYTLLLYAGMGGSLFFIPFDLINVQHYTPTAAGAAILPMIIILFVFSRFSGALSAKIGARPLMVAGALVAGAGFLLFGLAGVAGEDRSYWAIFFPAAVVLGFGAAMFVAPLTATVMNSIESTHAGIASGINNAISRTAGLIAIAALGLVLTIAFYSYYDRQIANSPISAATRTTLARDRDRLATGYVPTAIRGPDRQRVVAIVDTAFAQGLFYTMSISAILACAAAVTALVTIRPQRAGAVRRAA